MPAVWLGNDGSGNNNYWSPTNFSLTLYSNYDSMVDVPGIASSSSRTDTGNLIRGNYNTWNPLTNTRAGGTITQGNLVTSGSLNTRPLMLGTQYFNSGKWYCEVWCGAYGNSGDNKPVGITTVRGQTDTIGSSTLLTYGSGVMRAFANSNNNSLDFRDGFGNVIDQGTGQNWWQDGFWIGFAVDVDNNTMAIYKNGVLGARVTNCGLAGKEWTYFWEPESAGSRTPATNWYWNFGQQPFVYTPPAGHKGLCTSNLPTPVIKRPSDHFDVKTWTGNGAGQMIGTTAKQFASASINNSLRFKSNYFPNLSRTPSSAGSRTTWTWSAWVKRTSIGVVHNLMMAGSAASDYTTISLNSSDNLFLANVAGSANSGRKFTNKLFLTADWNHFVVVWDTTNTNANLRARIYVNGVEQSYSTSENPSLNQTSTFNNAVIHTLGSHSITNTIQNLDGYMADVHFIDGQALTPSSFGTFDANNNWAPKNYTGTYGTNGFELPLSAPTTLETLNYGASFNGVSQGLTTTATGLNASTGTWTVEGWAYSGSQTANEAIITGQVSGTDYFYWNYGGTTLYFGDGVTNTLTISNAKPDNRWFHWAIVKNGSTYTLYIDGVSIGSTTTALRSGVLTQWQIGIRTSQSYYWSGAISNVRVNTTTAVYTGNFTPQTTPLTTTQSAGTTNINAITSGTQLLTCNSATLVDNSTNAYAITNTGSVPVVSVAPWQRTVGYDASGNNNKFYPHKSFNFVPNLSAQPNVLYYGTPGTYTWTAPAGVTSVNYLVVGGGGGGGNGVPTRTTGAGGGAGGMLTGTLSVTPLTSYTVTVGAGGTPGTSPTNGGNSVFASITALGGGYGAYGGQNGAQGGTGGSGGGTSGPFAGGTTAGGLGTAGQGNNGGVASQYSMSGGGGAGGPGLTVNGGNGLISSITGTAIYYAGGSGVVPGLGGGGRQADNPTSPNAALPGVDGLGGGGGGGSNPTTAAARGGSGVVILSYTNASSYVGNGADSSNNNDNPVDSPVDTVDSNGNVVGSYATWSPNSSFVSEGGLKLFGTGATARASLSPRTGKWYAEFTCIYGTVGDTNTFYINGGNIALYGTSGNAYYNGSWTSYGTSYGNNDIIGCAVNMDDGTVTFYKNGVAQPTLYGYPNGEIVFSSTNSASNSNSGYYANFGQSPFVYIPPAGFKALNTKNLKDVGSYNLPDNYGNFVNTPDLVWLKCSSSASFGHRLTDTVRGPTRQILSHDTGAQSTDTGGLHSFLPNGFLIGSGGDYNTSGQTYASWNWNRGKIPGFDIVNYSGNGGVQTISHNLGVAPSWLVVKKLSTATNSNWMVYHSSLGPTKALNLNNTSTAGTTYWNSTAPTSNTFTLDSNANYNATNDSYIAYLWAEVPGFSKFGAYTNNNATDGTFIHTGFRPKFVLIKNHDNVEEWYILDSVRQTYNQAPPMSSSFLKPNSASGSSGSSSSGIDLMSNGFKIRTTNPASGEIGFGTRGYIYCAFAETPFKYANAR